MLLILKALSTNIQIIIIIKLIRIEYALPAEQTRKVEDGTVFEARFELRLEEDQSHQLRDPPDQPGGGKVNF